MLRTALVRLLVTTGLAVSVAGIGLASPASASRRGHRTSGARADTFSGSCQLSGRSWFTPPLTGTPTQGQDYTTATGPCSGSFTDRRGRVHELSGTQVAYAATVRGLTSCTAGTLTGAGVLRFPWGRLAFTISEVHGPGDGALQLTGRRGGLQPGPGRSARARTRC